MILTAHSQGPDQTARMRSLIRALAVPGIPEDEFSHGEVHIKMRLAVECGIQFIPYNCFVFFNF